MVSLEYTVFLVFVNISTAMLSVQFDQFVGLTFPRRVLPKGVRRVTSVRTTHTILTLTSMMSQSCTITRSFTLRIFVFTLMFSRNQITKTPRQTSTVLTELYF